MKAKVNADACIGCGACATICSEVFEISDEGTSTVKVPTISKDLESKVKDAIESCPTGAISEEDD